MSEQMYSVRVIDYSLPSFCSFEKFYYGTEQSIMALLSLNYEADSDVLQAAKDYFAGRGSGAASLFGEASLPLIKPVAVIGTSSYERDDVNFKFYNTYGCVTDMSIGHLNAQIAYIMDSDKKLKRCIQATISDVKHTGLWGDTASFTEEGWMSWGLPGMIEVKGATMRNTLFYADTIFANKHTLKKDMKHPHKPYLRNFFFEIYGDG